MHRSLLFKLSLLSLVGCAGSAGSIYEFTPSEAPLRYSLRSYGGILVETPMGDQQSYDSTWATLAIEIAGPTGAGHEVSVSFEELSMKEGGDLSARRHEGGGLIGQRFAGTLSETGNIKVTRSPEIPAELKGIVDPIGLFADILPPLPGDEAAGPWPHRTALTSETSMTMENTYEGRARFAGDTIWNGRSARLIVSEGTTSINGRGAPEGAPGEVELTLAGPATTTYVWDAARGVLLASSSKVELSGEVEVPAMVMTMPATYKGATEVSLLAR